LESYGSRRAERFAKQAKEAVEEFLREELCPYRAVLSFGVEAPEGLAAPILIQNDSGLAQGLAGCSAAG